MLLRYIFNRKALAISLFFVVILVFIPFIDIYISNIFFIKGVGFVGWVWGLEVFNMILMKSVLILSLVICLYTLWQVFFMDNKKNIIKYVTYIITMFFGVHIFIIHVLTKDIFGRARPLQILDFGGWLEFTGAFRISDQCTNNCSFVSGDVSAAFVFLSYCLMMPIGNIITKKRKVIMFNIAFFIGLIMCFFRISLGKHFFSDTFCSMIIVSCCSFGFYRLIFGKSMYDRLINDLL